MNVFTLMLRELWHDRLGLFLSLWVLALVAAVFAGVSLALADFDHEAQAVLDARQEAVQARMAELEDAMRRITKGLGFNVLIVPRQQELGELFAKDFASRTMPETYVSHLAGSQLVTVNHLLPTLEQRIEWPERDGRTVILVGVRGEVPLLHQDQKKPLLSPVKKGEIVVGHELARSEKIAEGDDIVLLDRSFRVAQVFPSRGDKRDITLWIDLGASQHLLDMRGLINGIWALQCKCALADIAKVRTEITRILPETQVIEKGTIALARAEARQVAADAAALALEQEKQTQISAQWQRRRFSLIIITTTAVAAALVVGALSWRNVRERRMEIGLFRALGVRSSQIAWLVLSRAGIVGLCSGVLGSLLGLAAILIARPAGQGAALSVGSSPIPWSAALAVLMTPLIACLAALAPAFAAARQHPAEILRDEGLTRGA